MKEFNDRKDAGKQLAKRIETLMDGMNPRKTLVLGLTRGGVPVAKEIADYFNLPLDVLIVRKIGAPLNSEYAIAAVSQHELVIGDHEFANYVKEQVEHERFEIKRRLAYYRDEKPPLLLKGKIVILVDDGLATGLSMGVALRELARLKPEKIIIAIPVAASDSLGLLVREGHPVIALRVTKNFSSVGNFYKVFNQITDEEVRSSLPLAKHK
ncbi:MAG: hypothetical protein UT28_C0001G0815 [Berkelbacteria bacterium GW2011_GWE1_39_12]|uniref:Phosphoribosyltransferase domain-containing protein n=1 Tax=Berkelbacteria bacterium GW2011_GWE1_39_12 TaxID=1618337 RepID=A0A0G4B408_9BACT|nr:MAG: hypothetical protein UT28_C0001G0815 [Berkelbacteria bacterium GW2011_GWE1_39_12]